MNFPRHDHPLRPILDAYEAHCAVLSKARYEFLSLEAERKSVEARLIKEAMGKSHAEKLMNAQAESAWLEFHKRLARVEAVFEHRKLEHEVLDKEYLAQYSALKLDQSMIRRAGIDG